ncbi:MAG: PadR family transcriptional regulator [Pseudomonadota bacterium]
MALPQAIMTALIDDDMSGIDLARSFEASLGLYWRASHQQIYQDLHKLADKGWLNRREVAQSGKPPKIIYGLTAAGRQALAEWVYAQSKLQPAKDDLMIKLYNLSSENVTHLIAEIEARREQTMQKLYLFEKIRRAHYFEPHTLPVRRQGVYLALLAAIRDGEQHLQWCDEAQRLLARVEAGA